ncbi:GNAT family N-acetyltransferase [Aliagarivorans marinus]|uniref:GNAT family N-acetyltransferase n=1 Tax=Aliagarivorans marinus TaxID=561965 RepID=UPI0005581059|nr:GNAT family N-acetyltransferase [Aliagarivorans marinus]
MSESRIKIRHANSSDNLLDIAELVYDTDPIIYPEIASCRDTAIAILAALIRVDCGPYCLSNILVADIDGQIAGISVCLIEQRPWVKELVASAYQAQGVPFTDTEKYVFNEYFYSLNEYFDDQTIYISNVCTKPEYRGCGVASNLLNYINRLKGSSALHVLDDNANAIRVYKSLGFKISKHEDGFAASGQPRPTCYLKQYSAT